MLGTLEHMRSHGIVVAEVSQKEPMETHPALSPQKVAKIVQLVEKSSKWLSHTEKQEVIDILAKYATVIPEREGDIGRTTVLQHSVYTGDAPPIQQQFRRVPFHQRTQCKKLLQDMLKKGVISPSSSPWTSPAVLAKKKDGTSRFCIDFRKLNAVTRKDAYRLPRIDDTLDSLSGTRWFSTLDLACGYWQVETAPSDREKTAFSTPESQFEFK